MFNLEQNVKYSNFGVTLKQPHLFGKLFQKTLIRSKPVQIFSHLPKPARRLSAVLVSVSKVSSVPESCVSESNVPELSVSEFIVSESSSSVTSVCQCLVTGGQSKEIYKTIYAGVLTVFPAWDECH